MNRESLIHFLQQGGLPMQGVAEEIAGQFAEKEIPKHTFFLQAGQISDEYLFLHEGCLRAFAHDTEGNEVTTHFYQAGQVVFEVHSFFHRTRSRENIQALTDCRGWVISFEQLNGFFHAIPAFREFGRSVLVKGFSGLKDRMLGMITETAEERYKKLLQQNPQIFQHAPLKHIASYLGITDSSLSRIRKEFSQK
ncbi:MAG TPA: Crp/Fnr family transcriptional regulator [Ferruginibacter sp.]|nr:Crp/Fnr family transcriptional regulator [Ferruginibacter sp.]